MVKIRYALILIVMDDSSNILEFFDVDFLKCFPKLLSIRILII